MEDEYDKRIKYCTPTCASIAKRQTMEKWNFDHRKKHICQHCLEPIECCGSKQRKYHPECAVIVSRKNHNRSPYNKRKQEELREHSQINRMLRDKYAGDGYIKDTSYDGFTTRKVIEENNLSVFNLSLINEREMDEICKDIERLCT